MSASRKQPRPLSILQFGILMSVLAVCVAAALFSVAKVTGMNGSCPGETQVSRPTNAHCYSAYRNQETTGVVGAPVAGN